jgi:hypothetical protein
MVRGVLKRATGVGALAFAVALALGVVSPGTALAAARPIVTHISPTHGSIVGGTTVTVRGRHFRAQGLSVVTKVTFAGRAATGLVVRSATRLTVRAPRGAGTAAVRVTPRQGSVRGCRLTGSPTDLHAPGSPVSGRPPGPGAAAPS